MRTFSNVFVGSLDTIKAVGGRVVVGDTTLHFEDDRDATRVIAAVMEARTSLRDRASLPTESLTEVGT